MLLNFFNSDKAFSLASLVKFVLLIFCSISELINHISNLDLFITGDSGPMHLAASFQIPTIAIFGPTKYDETSQWMNDNSIVVKKNLDCQPCMKRTCPLKHHNCMKLIKAQEVIDSIPLVFQVSPLKKS